MIKKYIAEFKDPKSLIAFFSNGANRKMGIHYYYNGDIRHIDIASNKDSVNCYPAVKNQFDKVVLKDEAGEMLTPEQAIPGQAFYTLSYCYSMREFHVLVSLDADSTGSAFTELLDSLQNDVVFISESDIPSLADAITKTLEITCGDKLSDEEAKRYASYLIPVEKDEGLKRGGESRFFVAVSDNKTQGDSGDIDEYWAKFKKMTESVQKDVFLYLIGAVLPEQLKQIFHVDRYKFKMDITKNDSGYTMTLSYEDKFSQEGEKATEEDKTKSFNMAASKGGKRFIWALVTCLGLDGQMRGKDGLVGRRGIDFGYSDLWPDILCCVWKAWTQKERKGELGEFHKGYGEEELAKRWNEKEKVWTKDVKNAVNALADAENMNKPQTVKNILGVSTPGGYTYILYRQAILSKYISAELLEKGDELFLTLVKSLMLQTNNRQRLYNVYKTLYASQFEEKSLGGLSDSDKIHSKWQADYGFLYYLMRISADGVSPFEDLLYQFFGSMKSEPSTKGGFPEPLSKAKKIYNDLIAEWHANTFPIELAQAKEVIKDKKVGKHGEFEEKGLYANLLFSCDSSVPEELKNLVGERKMDGETEVWVSSLDSTKDNLVWIKDYEGCKQSSK